MVVGPANLLRVLWEFLTELCLIYRGQFFSFHCQMSKDILSCSCLVLFSYCYSYFWPESRFALSSPITTSLNSQNTSSLVLLMCWKIISMFTREWLVFGIKKGHHLSFLKIWNYFETVVFFGTLVSFFRNKVFVFFHIHSYQFFSLLVIVTFQLMFFCPLKCAAV